MVWPLLVSLLPEVAALTPDSRTLSTQPMVVTVAPLPMKPPPQPMVVTEAPLPMDPLLATPTRSVKSLPVSLTLPFAS